MSAHTGLGRQPTVKDVAELAKVSWTTVSNVIHHHPYVRAETRARVEAAIEDLGYRPSLAGRQLRRGRSEVFALALADIESPYFAHLAHAVIVEAERRGFTVLIDETGGNIERERAAARGYRDRGIEGTIFSPVTMDFAEILELQRDTPMVLLGENAWSAGIDHVAIDNVASAMAATDHLLSTGRRKIAFMGYQPQGLTGTGDLRLEGYRRSLAAAGIPVNPELIIEAVTYTREEGELRARSFLPHVRDVDAILCANDLLAIGAMRCFRREGVAVPGDVALLGWDNMPDGEYSSPSLTTIAPDLPEIARIAVQSLLSKIDDPSRAALDLTVPYRLIVRESTASA